MSETEEPPAKVLKIDNFDQELLIPDIEPIGNGSAIPDGLGDAASVVDGEIPDRLGAGDEEGDVTGEIGDNDLTDAEDKETDQDTTNPGQGTDKPDQEITDAAAQQTDDTPDQELDNTDQDADKSNQDGENVDQGINKVDQAEDKTDQVADKLDQGLATDQDVSGSQEEMEGQEEWLSEGILTDDDLNANASTNHSEDDKQVCNLKQLESKTVEQNIEETLNHLDGSMEQEGDDEEGRDKKSHKNVMKQESTMMNQEPDDGNDTDDLLRMLGEDDNKKTKKKLTKTVKDLRSAIKNVMEASDDEEFEYDETSIRKLKVAKTAISKKKPPKAVPEDMDDGDDDTDLSSDEALATLKKSLNVKKPNILSKKLPPRPSQNLVVVKKAETDRQPLVNVVSRKVINSEKPVHKPSNSLLKPSSRSILKTSTPAKMVASKPNPDKKTRIEFKSPVKIATPFRAESILKTIEIKKEEPEEYVEDEEMPTNFDFESDIEEELNSRQRLMRPERMDEEVPSDGDSCDEDGSLYDELPSSESDDMDDWFHIDIRAERATDYLPLLGSKAKELLLEEKKRTSIRVANLRESLAALTETGRKQAEELRKATLTLAELDDMLKAT